jgi:hypothetical protein
MHEQRYGKQRKLRVMYVGFEVVTAVVMKRSIYSDITLCNPLKANRRIEGTKIAFTPVSRLKIEAT